MKRNALAILAGLLLLTGCATTQVKRVDPETVVDYSGRWNDADAQMTANEMIEDSLSRPWLTDWLRDKGRNPTIIVGHVENRSSEHIDSQVLTKYLERNLLNSGKINFVASSTERSGIRDERDDMLKGYTDPATLKRHGLEVGADFMLIGSVNSVADVLGGKEAILYQVNLELVNLATNGKVWIGQKSIKKVIKRSRAGL